MKFTNVSEKSMKIEFFNSVSAKSDLQCDANEWDFAGGKGLEPSLNPLRKDAFQLLIVRRK